MKRKQKLSDFLKMLKKLEHKIINQEAEFHKIQFNKLRLYTPKPYNMLDGMLTN